MSTSPTPASWQERLLVLTLGIVLVATLTYPTIPKFGNAGRLDTGDGRFSIWNVAWVAHSIVDDPRHLFDANIFYPHTGTLAYSELNLVAGVLGVPVYAATRNPLATLNSAIAIALLIAFMAMWALVRRLTGSSGAGLVAATVYAFCPFLASHTAEIQMLMYFVFPVALLAFHRVVDRPGVVSAMALGASVALAAFGCGYYGLYLLPMLAVAVLIHARRAPGYWITIAGAALVSAALVLPVLLPYLHIRAAAGGVEVRTMDQIRVWSANWSSYFASATFGDAWLTRRLPKFVEVLFPGFVTLGLAAVGFVMARRADASRGDRRTIAMYLTIALVAGWASFGPAAFLYRIFMALPLTSLMRAPARYGIVVTFGLAVVAGFGARAVSRGRPWMIPVLIVVAAVELFVPWGLHEAPALPAAYRLLATLPRGPVVEFPFPYDPGDFFNHTKAMWRSTYNWQPLVNGYSDLTPADFYAMVPHPITDFPNAESFALMHRLGVRYVIWDMQKYQGDARQRLLDRFPPYDKYMRRVTAADDVWLYEIIGWP